MPKISVASVEAETTDEPLEVELRGGATVKFLPLESLPSEDAEIVSAGLAEVSDLNADRPDARDLAAVLGVMNRILKHSMTPNDQRKFREARVPVRSQIKILEALGEFYMGAGTPGEGSDSAS